MNPMKKEKNKAAQALAKLRHIKSPRPAEDYKKMSELGRAGREAYWKKRKEEKDAVDTSSA
jgi:hypothetical protein